METHGTKIVKENHKKIENFFNSIPLENREKIYTNGQIGAFLMDNYNFYPVSTKSITEEIKNLEPYEIGTWGYNGTRIFVDPNRRWSDNTIEFPDYTVDIIKQLNLDVDFLI